MIGTVLIPNIKGKTLVQNNSRYFVINAIGYYKGQEIMFDYVQSKQMPSFLYAIGEMFEDQIPEAITFIKENF